MFNTSDHHVDTDDKVRAYILGDPGFPVIKIGDVNIYPPNEGTSTWLRDLIDQLEDLREQIILTASHDEGAALAEKHMAEAMAAAGITS